MSVLKVGLFTACCATYVSSCCFRGEGTTLCCCHGSSTLPAGECLHQSFGEVGGVRVLGSLLFLSVLSLESRWSVLIVFASFCSSVFDALLRALLVLIMTLWASSPHLLFSNMQLCARSWFPRRCTCCLVLHKYSFWRLGYRLDSRAKVVCGWFCCCLLVVVRIEILFGTLS